jgi:hypothetical protein
MDSVFETGKRCRWTEPVCHFMMFYITRCYGSGRWSKLHHEKRVGYVCRLHASWRSIYIEGKQLAILLKFNFIIYYLLQSKSIFIYLILILLVIDKANISMYVWMDGAR